MSEVTYRKSTRVEFVEAGVAPGVPAVTATTPVAGLPPPYQPFVTNAGFASIEKKALLVGGYHCGNVPEIEPSSVDQVLEYDLTTKQWTNLSGSHALPTGPRSDCTMIALGQSYYLFGGYNDDAVVASMLKLAVLPGESAKASQWQEVPSETGPCPRRFHSFTPFEAEMKAFVFGGFDGQKRLDDLWEFDSSNDSWTLRQTTGLGPSPRDSHNVVIDPLERTLYVFGGFSHARVNDLHALDLETWHWTQVSIEISPSPRSSCFAAYHGGFCVFGLGRDVKGPSTNVFHFALSTKRWTVPVVEGDELDAAVDFSWCVADNGKKVLIYGGGNDKRYTSTLFEFELERGEPLATTKGKK